MSNRLSLFLVGLLLSYSSIHAQTAFIFPSSKISGISETEITLITNDYLWGGEIESGNAVLSYTGKSLLSNDSLLIRVPLDKIQPGKVLNVSRTLSYPFQSGKYPSEINISRYITVHDSLKTAIFQKIFLIMNPKGFVSAELFSTKKLFGKSIPVQKKIYDFSSDSLTLKMQFNNSEPLSDVSVLLTATLGQDAELMKKIKIGTINSGDEFKFEIGTLPESFRFGGKVLISAEIYNSQKELLFSLDEISIFLKGLNGTDKNITKNTIDPFGLEVYPDDEIESLFNIAEYFADSQERLLIKNLVSRKDKISFLNTFWTKRENTTSKYLPNFVELINRIRICTDRKLSRGDKHFWKSDRVRIVLVYGVPDQIDKEPFGMNNFSSETWSYNQIENGVKFVFVDLTKDGDFRLVHSSKTGEIYNPTYKNQYEKKSDFD